MNEDIFDWINNIAGSGSKSGTKYDLYMRAERAAALAGATSEKIRKAFMRGYIAEELGIG